MKIKVKEKRGISLIVLVITIIIMIILAGAVILSLNSSNVVSKATEARQKSDIANAKNVVALAKSEWELMSSGDKAAAPYNNLFNNYAQTKLEAAGYAEGTYEVTENGELYVLPAGFKASIYEGENTVAGGLVIYETESPLVPDTAGSTTNRDEARTTYNQYVWIPVEGNLEQYDWSQQKLSLKNWGSSSFKDALVETIPVEISNSIKKDGGFYIGRYEAGVPSGGSAEVQNGTQKPVSKKGAQVWSGIPWDANSPYDGTGNGCVKVAKLAYENSTSVESHLIYGAEWDAALKFISKEKNVVDSKSWGNYTDYTGEGTYTRNKIQLAGANENWKANNIYDMAGNLSEWTMEFYTSSGRPVLRGAHFNIPGASYPAAMRSSSSPEYIFGGFGFRIALRIK